jgi:hypothetical protein
MCRMMAGALVLTAAVAYPGPGSPGAGGKVPDAADFVWAAVYDGLTADGVEPALAAELAENPDFVKGCKLCAITEQAMKQYSKLPKAPAAKPGRGMSADTVKKLRSKDRDARRESLRDLIGRYTAFAYNQANLTAEQRKVLEGHVKAMAYTPKNPEDGLPHGFQFCPSCDGTCKPKQATTP